jgi:hypothetical protein
MVKKSRVHVYNGCLTGSSMTEFLKCQDLLNLQVMPHPNILLFCWYQMLFFISYFNNKSRVMLAFSVLINSPDG